jgi:hypothetical protein
MGNNLFGPHFFQYNPLPDPLYSMQVNVAEKIRRHHLAGIDPMKGMITSYLASPKGQEMIQNYLSSPEGQKAICEFTSTEKGRATMKNILPSILSCLCLPAEIQSTVTQKLKEIP